MTNVFELMASIGLDTKDYDRGLDNSKKGANDFAEAFKGIMAKLAIAKGLKTIADGIINVTKQAVKAFQEYEQLAGGVDTLFGDSAAETVINNADEAYRRAGLSANEYLNTVTSFSASLIQSLGGDTDKAAEVADTAIVDMADNVNKMGTSMESVQAAYAGFAKGNYTMLDNLRLGYGGTRTEMERLLADAEELTGKHYDISSYADIIEAIHEIQRNMGIAGATAEEAETTIEGSLKMASASWQNLILALSSGKDLQKAIQNFTKSAKTYIGNVIPVAKQALSGIAEFVTEIAPIIIEELPGLLDEILPAVINGVEAIFTSVAKILPTLLSSVINTAWNAITSINWSELGQTILNLITSAFGTIWDILKSLFTGGASDAENDSEIQGVGSNIWAGIKKGLGTAASWLADIFNDISKELENLDWNGLGVKIWNFLKAGLGFIGDAFLGLLTGSLGESEDQGDWQKLGSSISRLIQSGINGVSITVSSFITTLAQDILAHDWFGDGKSVGDSIIQGVNGEHDFGLGFFDRFNKWLHNAFRWDHLGQSLGLLIGSGITGISETLGGLIFGAFEKGVEGQGPNWANIGKTIVKALFNVNLDPSVFHAATGENGIFGLSLGENGENLFNLGNLLQQAGINKMFGPLGPVIGPAVNEFLDNFKVGLEEGLGPIFEDIGTYISDRWEETKPLLVQFGDDVSKPFKDAYKAIQDRFRSIGAWFDRRWKEITESSVFQSIQEALSNPFETVKGIIGSLIDKVQGLIDKIREMLGLANNKTSEKFDKFAEKVGSSTKGKVTRIAEETGEEVARAVVYSIYDSNLSEAIQDKIRTGINTAKIPTLVLQAQLSLTPPDPDEVQRIWDGHGASSVWKGHASAMDSGEILKGITPFGIGPGGVVHYGGEAGDEAVVGVNSLDSMIQKSVRSAMRNAETVTRPLNVQLVLDSGVLLGEINLGLNDVAEWEGGGHA